MDKKADRDHVRRHNRSVVLQTLRRKGPLARIELGQLTKLSPATVTAITSDLLDESLILEVPGDDASGATSRGRPRILLQLNSDAALILAIRITINTIGLALANYAGEFVYHQAVRFDSSHANRETFPALLEQAVADFMTQHDINPNIIREITIAAQGVVDLENGAVTWSPALADSDMPIIETLKRRFKIPCRLSNDANMLTQAVHWSDPEKYSSTFAVIMMDYGVGMGLYLNNQIFDGAAGKAAEFGHANHIPGGALCRCGRRGCLEAYLADYALIRSAQGLPETTPPENIVSGAEGLFSLIKQAQQGDPHAIQAFEKAGVALAYGLARLQAIIDPKRIVLTGVAVQAFSFMEASMKSALEDALVNDLRQTTKIDILPWKDNFILQGLVFEATQRIDQAYAGH